jgi:glycolate oxidase FAD binding subunit
LSSSIAASFGPGQVRYGRDTDAVDGLVPAITITARTEADVVTVIDEARGGGLAVVAAGGGNLLSVGNLPDAYDIRLSTTGLSSAIERRPDDMTVTVEAGVTLGRLNRLLAADGQRVALDPASPDDRTMGGLVAAADTGGLHHAFGGPRDLVLGMTVADGAGRLLALGGQVVKNVAGYDLVRLFTGSFGTLGVITSVTLRTHPLPVHAVRMTFEFATAADLAQASAAITASELPLASLDFHANVLAADGAERVAWHLVALAEGTAGEIGYQRERLDHLARRPGVALREDAVSPVHATGDDAVVVRAGVAPSEAVDLAASVVEAARARCDSVRVAGRLGDGLVRVSATPNVPVDALALIRIVAAVVADRRGRAVLERAPVAAKTDLDVWGGPPAGFRLMQELKNRFDPDGVFARGRFVGGL